MPRYEYKVVPAPNRAVRVKGVKGTDARFAAALATLMNDFGADGWEYQRTDTLPCEERSGLTGRTTTFQNMLVFRRGLESEAVAAPELAVAHPVERTAPVLAAPVFRSTAHSEDLSVSAPEGSTPALTSAVAAAGTAPAIDLSDDR